MPMIDRISRGTAAPIPAPIPTPVQSLPDFGDVGAAAVVADTTIDGRLAADTSTEEDEVDKVFEVGELGEVAELDVVDEPVEVDDDASVD
jgi:hypothetical protein